MIKEKVWPVRVMYMLIAAALAISLLITGAPTLKVSADPGLSEWTRVSTPTTDGWVLAPQSSIRDHAVADGGVEAFAIVDSWNGTAYVSHLLKSTDHAATWDDITDALEDELDDDEAINTLLRVACDPENADFLAVAVALNVSPGTTYVFISEDGGATFRNSGEVEDGGVYLDSVGTFELAVSPEDDGVRNIAIGGYDTVGDSAIFRCLALGDIGTGWIDATDYDGWDDNGAFSSMGVIEIVFAPSWAADKTILVLTVTYDGAVDFDIHMQCGTWGTTEAWNIDSTLAIDAVLIIGDVFIPVIGRFVGGITLPQDYSGRYTDKRYAWVWVNYWYSGPVVVSTIFRVKNTSVNPIGWQIEDESLWLTNVSYMGYISEGKAIAGVFGAGDYSSTPCCEGVQVYRNDNIVNMDICCYDWEPSCKPPTGADAMEAFYVSEDKAYAVALMDWTDYDESAWSVSFDDGDIWNQLSLVDTYIDYLSDVAVSPDCNKTMLVSINDGNGCDCDSVWLHAENLPEAEEYSGQWLRTWHGLLTGDHPQASEWGLLRLAPEETTGDTVYLVDYGTDVVYWNTMETLGCWEQGTASVDQIVDLAVKDKETIFAVDDGGAVAMSDDYAVGWHPAVDSLVQYGFTIAVWGDDVLVGGEDGEVSHSDDGGETFTELDDLPYEGYGLVTVAFDSYFDINAVIYAATTSATVPIGGGVYRWVIDESEKWTDLRATPQRRQVGLGGCDGNGSSDPCDDIEVNFTGLVVDNADGNPMTSPDTGGVLYASYVGWDDECGDGFFTGVARYLTPAEDVVCKECGDWDWLYVGLHLDVEMFCAVPDALKICGCLTPDSNSKLFAIDDWADGSDYDMDEGQDRTVWTFEDCFSKGAPDLTSPADGATIPADPCECIPLPFALKWERQCNACSYDIQISLDEDFTEVLFDSRYLCTDCGPMLDPMCSYVPAAGDTPSFFVMEKPYDIYLLCEYTYYWRVRSADAETGQVIHSWWSDAQSFTVAPGPGAGVNLISPENGATGVPVKNVGFSWSSVASADEYDWVLSANADLSSPIATSEGLTTTATTYTGADLDYETPYFWQVTSYKEGGVISMSAIGTFTTMAEPEEPYVPPPTETPTWVWVVIAIGAVLVIVVIVLIFRTRRV